MPDLKKLITLEALQAALPSWLKSSSKPSYTADEISDTNTTNKFVTSTEKNTWNAKGTYSKPTGGIPKSDLSQLVQNSLDLADSALQSESDPTVPSWAKQTNKPSYTQDEVTDGTTYKRVTQTEKNAWSGKQNALTTTQMSAVNSGINSTKVGQISTNQTNILYNLNMGVKNLIRFVPGTFTNNVATFEITNDGKVIINSTSSGSSAITNNYITLPAGTYRQIGISVSGKGDVRLMNGSTRITDNPFTLSAETTLSVVIFSYATNRNVVITPMLCTEEAYAQSTAYQPPALPNYDLTRLEAEDRAALAEEIDAGAKNKFNPANIVELRNLATNGSDYAYVSTVTDTRTQCNFCVFSWNGNTKIDQLTKVDVTANGKIALIFTKTANYNKISFGHSGQSKDLMIFYNVSDLVNGQTYVLSTNVTQFNPSVTNFAFSDVMLCTKAAFGVSNKFVPYRPNYQDLINATAIEVLTSSDIFIPNTNYTTINDGAIYKQGKHIFGNLVVSKSDGNFNTVETTIGQIKTGYRPVKLYIGNGTTFNTSQWGVNGVGYCYIPASVASTPNVIVKTSTDAANKYNVVIIRIDYCTP